LIATNECISTYILHMQLHHAWSEQIITNKTKTPEVALYLCICCHSNLPGDSI